jgi:hypothetical protein
MIDPMETFPPWMPVRRDLKQQSSRRWTHRRRFWKKPDASGAATGVTLESVSRRAIPQRWDAQHEWLRLA